MSLPRSPVRVLEPDLCLYLRDCELKESARSCRGFEFFFNPFSLSVNLHEPLRIAAKAAPAIYAESLFYSNCPTVFAYRSGQSRAWYISYSAILDTCHSADI